MLICYESHMRRLDRSAHPAVQPSPLRHGAMRILLIDDQTLVRQGLRCLLASMPGAQVSEAATAAEGLTSFRKARPDVVILSNSLERTSGPVFLKRLLKEQAQARVLILGHTNDTLYAVRSIQAGARGFISRHASSSELIAAVQRLLEGRKYIDKEMATVLVGKRLAGGHDVLESLTMREIEIIRLLGQGKSMKAIATHLGIAYKTVANACSALKTKLAMKRTADLIRLAIELEGP